MVTLLLRLLRLLPLLFGAHRHVALENLALRHQLAVYKRTLTRPKVRKSDRLFWVALSRVWADWRQALVIVSPNTVLRWQRPRFCEHWTKLSARPIAGRPPVNAEIKALVIRMAAANPLWGAPRIHGELLRLGIDVCERTPSRASCRSGGPCRLRPGGRSSPTMSATWSPSISSRCQPRACASSLFSSCSLTTAWRVVHFNVTEHPTARWTAQQIVDAFPDDSAPAYLLRDRDQVCGEQFRHRVQGMRIEEVLTAPHSPWQNPFAERLIGSIRGECLDHVLVLGESHLRRILLRDFSYYHRARTHLALDKDAPDVGPVELPEVGGIVEIPEVGGLHHRYVRQAA